MLRISIALASVALITGAAHASTTTEVTTDLEFDRALLTTEAGAADVLASLEDQARAVCTIDRYGIPKITVDTACADDLVAQAVEQIADETLSSTFAGTIGTF